MVAGCDVLAGLLHRHVAGNVTGNVTGNVKDARLKRKSRRPLQNQTKPQKQCNDKVRGVHTALPDGRYKFNFLPRFSRWRGGSVHRLAFCWFLWRRILKLVKSDAY